MPPGTQPRHAAVTTAAFSADGHTLATVAGISTPGDTAGMSILTNDDVATIWNADNGQRLAYIEPQGQPIERLALDAAGARLAVALRGGTVRLYRRAGGAPLRSFQANIGGHVDKRWRGLSFSPDGARLLTSTRGAGDIRDPTSGRLIATLATDGATIGQTLMSPDGKTIASADDSTARLYDATTGLQKATLSGHRLGIRAMVFDPNGSSLVTASTDGDARRWPVFASLDGLVARMKHDTPRCLTRDERRRMFLEPEPPCWCAGLMAAAPAEAASEARRCAAR